jgi:hypothetical protein
MQMSTVNPGRGGSAQSGGSTHLNGITATVYSFGSGIDRTPRRVQRSSSTALIVSGQDTAPVATPNPGTRRGSEAR